MSRKCFITAKAQALATTFLTPTTKTNAPGAPTYKKFASWLTVSQNAFMLAHAR